MPRLGRCTLALSLGFAAALWVTVSYAQSDAHATAETANCLAKRGANYPIGYCSTATPVPTSTPVPTQEATPTIDPPTDVPTDVPTPVPALPVTDQPLYGYLRPLSDPWMELALPQGRWAITYDTSLCDAPAAWTNVYLTLDTDSHRPITGPDLCALAQWQWLNNAPCATNDDGYCDVSSDPSFWYMLSLTPTATDTPEPVPTDTPSPQPVAQPRPASAPAPAPASAPQPAQPQVIVETVVVEATDTPTPTRLPTSTATISPSVTATKTQTPRPSNSPAVVASPSATATAVPKPQGHSIVPDWVQGPLGILVIVGIIVFGVIGTIVVLLIRGRLS